MSPWFIAGVVFVFILGIAFGMWRRPNAPPPVEPPSAERVALRALALAASVARAHVEAAAVTEKKLPLEEAERHRAALESWLRREQLTEQLTEREQAWVEAPVGKLGEDGLLEASWCAEGLGVLLWAMSAAPAPPPDGVEVEPGSLLERVPAVGSDVGPFVAASALRPPEEISSAAERTESRYDDACRDDFGSRVASRAMSIAMERRRAHRWLSGESSRY